MNKYSLLGIFSLSFIGGCAVMDALIGSPDGSTPGILPEAQKLLTASDNPSYVLGGVAVAALTILLKAIALKRNIVEIVSSVDDGFNELDDHTKQVVKDAISKSMPADAKKIVASIKKVL